MFRRWWWLLLLALGPAELLAHRYFAERAPGLLEYRAVESRLRELKQPGDVLLIAPRWAQPIARTAFGDSLLPIRELAGLDLKKYRRALVLSSVGESAPEAHAFLKTSEERMGPFTLEIRENRHPGSLKADLVERVLPSLLEVALISNSGERRACAWNAHSPVRAGGLGGPAAFPRERFQCVPEAARFVGLSIVDDQDYRPRRCIWAHPPETGYLELKFRNLPQATELRGAAGLSYLLTRDGEGSDVQLAAFIDGAIVGRHLQQDLKGWQPFAFAMPPRSLGGSFDLSFRISSASSPERHFCFQAEIW